MSQIFSTHYDNKVYTSTHIKALRYAHGLTQDQFASVLRISIDTLRYWERGKGIPSSSAQSLLERFQKDPHSFL